MAEETEKTNGGDVVSALEKFFLDLVGTIAPGCVLLLLGWLLFTTPFKLDWKSVPFFPEKSPWILIVGLAYVLGHGIASIGDFVLVRIFDWSLSKARMSHILKGILGNSLKPQSELFVQIERDPTFVSFVEACRLRIPTLPERTDPAMPILVWRSLAMSFSPNQRQTVYRFMFLSLLNLGVGTSFIAAAITTMLVWLGHWNKILPEETSGPTLLAVPLFLLAALPFLERRYYFDSISTKIPFGMALAEMARTFTDPKPVVASIGMARRSKCVYLAGGFRSKWQEKVATELSSIEFRDPSKHGLKEKDAYTLWDLEAIRQCDLVFAYLEAANPGGYALALEVGFAKGIGKRIILVNEKGSVDPQAARALQMVEAVADVSVKTFEEGINVLAKMTEVL